MDIQSILDSAKTLDKKENKEFKRKSGRRSKYDDFVDLARDLPEGQGITFDVPVDESTVSGVRNRIYKKLGKHEWSVNAEKVKEEDGDPLYQLHIDHLNDFEQNGEAE